MAQLVCYLCDNDELHFRLSLRQLARVFWDVHTCSEQKFLDIEFEANESMSYFGLHLPNTSAAEEACCVRSFLTEFLGEIVYQHCIGRGHQFTVNGEEVFLEPAERRRRRVEPFGAPSCIGPELQWSKLIQGQIVLKSRFWHQSASRPLRAFYST